MNNTVLITTSGIGERLKYLTEFTNKALVKVGDKFAISHIIDNYDENTEFIITLGYFGNHVKEFLTLAYPSKNITYVCIDNYHGEGSSLGYSLLQARNKLQKPFVFHCCDSIITKKIDITKEENILYVFPAKNSIHYTSIVTKNDNVQKINNKNTDIFDYIYTGICLIHNYIDFWSCLETQYNIDRYNTQLSDVDSISNMIHNNNVFKYKVLDNWYDIGNIDSYEITTSVFIPKYHVLNKNYESLCFIDNKVIKFINDKEINNKRVIRGAKLGSLVPKIYNYTEHFICMEFINGHILSEIYDSKIVYKLLTWAKKYLWIEQHQHIDNKETCKRFYIDKTVNRLNKLDILQNEVNTINGLECKNIINTIQHLPLDLLVNDTFCNYHGDFILDNILQFDNIFKLIDWRHEFDTHIHKGDIYYDLAKLRHNLIFNHFNILNEMYTIKYENNNVIVDLKCNYFLIQQLSDLDKFVIENQLNLNRVKLLTSIIWLNMSPLYKGKLREFLFYFGKYNLFLLIE